MHVFHITYYSGPPIHNITQLDHGILLAMTKILKYLVRLVWLTK